MNTTNDRTIAVPYEALHGLLTQLRQQSIATFAPELVTHDIATLQAGVRDDGLHGLLVNLLALWQTNLGSWRAESFADKEVQMVAWTSAWAQAIEQLTQVTDAYRPPTP